jgi:protein-disulfide isomerase
VNLDRNTLIGGGVAAVLLLGGLGYWVWGTGSSTDDAQVAADCKPIETFEVTDADYALGKADAPLTLIEYASMTCPHCAQFSREVFPQLREHYIDKGYVRYVFREFPLDRVALTASVTGRCLAKDAYVPFVELMFGEIETWARSDDPRAAIKEMARRAGMSGDEFEKCLAKEDDAKRVLEVQKKAMKDYCVGGTPTFLLNGKILATAEIEWTALDQKLRDAAKEKGVTIPTAAATPADGATTPAEGAATAPADGAAAPAAGGEGSTPQDGSATPAGTSPPAAATPAPAAPATAPPAQ